MERKSLIGLAVCGLLFMAGFAGGGNVGLYFNLAALLIVVGGAGGAAFVSFRPERLSIMHRVLRSSFRRKRKDPAEIVEILVDLAVKSRVRGVRSLAEDEEETSIAFLRRALGFVVDNYTREQTADILNTEMVFFRHRRDETERAFRSMADLCPAFGLAGSIVGLIGMLAGVEDTSIILATIPIALVSTLYGVVFANFFFLPFATRIREHTDHELLLQKIIMEGVLAIQSECNPRVLEMKLKSFLTPSSREGRIVSLQRIQERFHIRPEEVPAGETGRS